MKRLLWPVIAALLIAACGPFGNPSAEEIVRRAEAAMETLEVAHAVVEVSATVDGETMSLTGEGWMDGDRARSTILAASVPELVGALAVTDGSTGWLYHPEAGHALTGDLAALEAYRDENMASELDALPADADLTALTDLVDYLLTITDQKLVGEEQIAGLDAWHLQLTPNTEAPREWVAAGGIVELWISKQYEIPLQVAFSGNPLGEGRVTVTRFDPEPALEPRLFSFDAPAGVETIDVVELLPERLTLPEARERAAFPLLSTPADSAEAALVDVLVVGESIVQRFEGTLGEWTLMQAAVLDDARMGMHKGDELSRGEQVPLRGTTALLSSDPEKGHTTLAWEEDGVWRVVAGGIGAERAMEIAEGLE